MKPNQLAGAFASLCTLSIGIQSTLAGGGPPCPDCVIEVHAVVDSALFDQLGFGAEDYVRDVIAGMDAVWSMPINAGGMDVRVVLSEITINAKGDPWALSTDSFALLLNFSNYTSSTFPIDPDGRDAVLMFSGLDFDGSTVGLSYQSRLCAFNSVGILEANSFSLEWVTNIANHQLGHIAGAEHDGVGNSCDMFSNIMSPSSNPANPIATFSSCTVQYFSDLIQNSIVDIPACLATPAQDCQADLTGDGLLDFFDISAFLTAFGAGDMVADFSGDGTLDFFDISAFLTLFSSGCP